jgi:hypothetical protein
MLLTIILVVLFVVAVLMLAGVIPGNPLWLILAILGVLLFAFLGGRGLF